MMTIVPVRSKADILAVRQLFQEYAASLPFELGFQNFDQELLGLPGDYGPPWGCLLLATLEGHPAGCVALRFLEPGIGEMKRLFVRPEYRRLGIGKKLTLAILEEAGKLYHRFRLDTTPTMTEAIQL